MKKLILLILLSISVNAYATDVTIPTVYQTNGSVTSVNLNGNFTAVAQKINGGLDNDNADTTSGYRFFETKSSLPTAGTQGRTIFLTTDNTLNLDTGSTYVKSVVTGSIPAQGDVIYYTGSGWSDLVAGTSGKFLRTQGSGANPVWSSVDNATNLVLSGEGQGAIAYKGVATWAGLGAGSTAGLVLKTNTSLSAPSWTNSLGGVLDYGTSASASTAKQGTATITAFGEQTIAGNGNQAITNLTFTGTTSYKCVTGYVGTDINIGSDTLYTRDSGAQITLYNGSDSSATISWICIGT